MVFSSIIKIQKRSVLWATGKGYKLLSSKEKLMVLRDYKGKPDPNLLKAVARARLWFDELASGQVTSIADIFKREGLNQGYFSRLLKLAFLPQKAVEPIVTGTQSKDWIVNLLTNKKITAN